MTLKRLLIVVSVLIVLAGGGMMWLGSYAYTPQGRARIIIAQLRGHDTTLRGWLLKHHVVRQGFSEPPPNEYGTVEDRYIPASDEMAKLGHEALPVVIEALKDDNPDVLYTAVRTCGKFHDSTTIDPLAKCLHDVVINHPVNPGDETPFFLFEDRCVSMLLDAGPEAFGFILEATKECHYRTRRSMPDAMVKMWGAAALPHLVELLNDHDFLVRSDAAYHLGKLKDRRATDILVRYLNGSDSCIRSSAAEALGEIGDHRAIPALLQVLAKKQNPRNTNRAYCISAAAALARMGRDEGLTYLKAMLKSPTMCNRLDTINALAFQEIPGAMELLLSMLDDKEDCVRWEALQALGKLHDPRAVPAVRKLLTDSGLGVREAAAETLEKLGVKPPPASQPGGP